MRFIVIVGTQNQHLYMVLMKGDGRLFCTAGSLLLQILCFCWSDSNVCCSGCGVYNISSKQRSETHSSCKLMKIFCTFKGWDDSRIGLSWDHTAVVI